MRGILELWGRPNLVQRVIAGLAAGIILALALGGRISFVAIFGELFVGALRALAPVLVFVLIVSVISRQKTGTKTNMRPLIGLYAIGTFIAAFTAAAASFIFPVRLELAGAAQGAEVAPPSGIAEVLLNLLMRVVDNPVNAIAEGNYIGILAWALVFGASVRTIATPQTKEAIGDIADTVTAAVRLVLRFAPLGIMGLVYAAITESGLVVFAGYGRLLAVLVSAMFAVYLVVNPVIVFILMRQNPYPLVFRCLRESGTTAFFIRSSVANIPVNLKLCEDMGLDKATYSIAVPLGANVKLQCAAVTITVMVLATVNSVGMAVDFPSALLLCLAAVLGATGASGVPGGSLLLIPVGANVFGIPQDIAMQVVGVGFIISVLQDSLETALDSSTDPILIAALEQRRRRKEGLAPLDFRGRKG